MQAPALEQPVEEALWLEVGLPQALELPWLLHGHLAPLKVQHRDPETGPELRSDEPAEPFISHVPGTKADLRAPVRDLTYTIVAPVVQASPCSKVAFAVQSMRLRIPVPGVAQNLSKVEANRGPRVNA
ncbi:Zinc Finger Zz-Type And Ef-Hand Domain-Containing Protein 1 [Manis pentadactyla]|nr:Zinc Finger Zz-Type And Ef-Hand Domain-Containing Protein 1 [Manis pentadactyla]